MHDSVQTKTKSLRDQIGQDNLVQSSVLATRRLDEALLRLDEAVGRTRSGSQPLSPKAVSPETKQPRPPQPSGTPMAVVPRPKSHPGTGPTPQQRARLKKLERGDLEQGGLELDESIVQSSSLWLEPIRDTDESQRSGEAVRYRLDEGRPSDEVPKQHFQPAKPISTPDDETVSVPSSGPAQDPSPASHQTPAPSSLEALFADPINVMMESVNAASAPSLPQPKPVAPVRPFNASQAVAERLDRAKEHIMRVRNRDAMQAKEREDKELEKMQANETVAWSMEPEAPAEPTRAVEPKPAAVEVSMPQAPLPEAPVSEAPTLASAATQSVAAEATVVRAAAAIDSPKVEPAKTPLEAPVVIPSAKPVVDFFDDDAMLTVHDSLVLESSVAPSIVIPPENESAAAVTPVDEVITEIPEVTEEVEPTVEEAPVVTESAVVEEAPVEPLPVVELEPFVATWQVSEFIVPPTVDELFLAGSIAEQLAGRLAAAKDKGLHSIAVTSSKPGEGRSTVAIGMALSVAFSGLKVALVDADPAGVKLVTDLHLELDNSWLDTVRTRMPLEEVAVYSQADSLTLIPLLDREDEPEMEPAELKQLLEKLKASFDLVVVDCGASEVRSASLCDTALVVRDMQNTKALEVETLAISLRRSGLQGVGVVENFCKPKSSQG
ncbi:tyrosine-protein kinase family protein [Neorhodopirellula lusitana]|uniref:tyrosine-protein kinase family protein n=1 Tax=Neorhodopirellula lusitana TaxID=445327 RepID=UPI00384F8812